MELKDADGREIYIDEGEAFDITFRLDAAGHEFVKDAVMSIEATLFDRATREIINGWDKRTVYDENDGSISDDGFMRLKFSRFDAIIVDPSRVSEGKEEDHILRLIWEWVDTAGTIRRGIAEMRMWVRRLREAPLT